MENKLFHKKLSLNKVKPTTFLFLALGWLVFFSNCTSPERKIIGKWYVVKTQNMLGKTIDSDGDGAWIEFEKDHVVKIGGPHLTNRTGKWSYENKILHLKFSEKTRYGGDFVIKHVDAKKMILVWKKPKLQVHYRKAN
jgi:hypothetical protein